MVQRPSESGGGGTERGRSKKEKKKKYQVRFTVQCCHTSTMLLSSTSHYHLLYQLHINSSGTSEIYVGIFLY